MSAGMSKMLSHPAHGWFDFLIADHSNFACGSVPGQRQTATVLIAPCARPDSTGVRCSLRNTPVQVTTAQRFLSIQRDHATVPQAGRRGAIVRGSQRSACDRDPTIAPAGTGRCWKRTGQPPALAPSAARQGRRRPACATPGRRGKSSCGLDVKREERHVEGLKHVQGRWTFPEAEPRISSRMAWVITT